MGCSEAEMIFLGCLKISRTDPTICVSAEFPPGQYSFLGHVLRKRGIEYEVVTGKVEGKRDRGRQRQTFPGWIGKCFDKSGMDIIRLAENRTFYHAVTANVRI